MDYSVSYSEKEKLFFVYKGGRKIMGFSKEAAAWDFIRGRIRRGE
jgi:hypothetical protein